MTLEDIHIPKGWELQELQNVTTSYDGKRIPLNKSQRHQMSGPYPYYGASGQIDSINDYKFDGTFLLLSEDGENLNTQKKPIAFIANGKFWVNNHAHVLKPTENLTIEYLCYYLNSLKIMKYAQEQATRPKLKKSDMDKIPIVFPDKPIQRKIVHKLDSILYDLKEKKKRFLILSQLDGIEHAGRKNIVSHYNEIIRSSKQSILDHAINGKFTAKWREKNQDFESGIELLKRIQKERKNELDMTRKTNKKYKKKNSVITILGVHPTIPSWALAKLENLIYIAGRIGWKGLTSDEYTKDGPLFLSVYSLNFGDEVNLNEAFHISQKRFDESPEIQLQENDILLAKDGNIGKIGLVRNLTQSATVNSSLLVIRSKEAFVPEFLFYVLSGPTLQKLARERTEKVTVPHLYQRDIKNFTLPVPPISEQIEIVRILDSKLNLFTQIEKKIQELTELNNDRLRYFLSLEKSILNTAFSGKLIN